MKELSEQIRDDMLNSELASHFLCINAHAIALDAHIYTEEERQEAADIQVPQVRTI